MFNEKLQSACSKIINQRERQLISLFNNVRNLNNKK